MRRKLIIIGVTAVLLALLSGVEQFAVYRVTNEALAATGEILELIRNDELARCLEVTRSLDEMWDAHAERMETLIDHRATDEVRYAFSRLIAALEMGDGDTAMVYASELEGGVEHVQERQALTLQNLL